MANVLGRSQQSPTPPYQPPASTLSATTTSASNSSATSTGTGQPANVAPPPAFDPNTPAADLPTLDQVIALIGQSDPPRAGQPKPQDWYGLAITLDQASIQLQDIGDRYRGQIKVLDEAWQGSSATAFGWLGEDLAAVLPLVDPDTGMGSLVSQVGDALANAQRRLNNLVLQRTQQPGTDPAVLDQQARQILTELATSYQEIGDLLAGSPVTFSGPGAFGSPPPEPFPGAWLPWNQQPATNPYQLTDNGTPNVGTGGPVLGVWPNQAGTGGPVSPVDELPPYRIGTPWGTTAAPWGTTPPWGATEDGPGGALGRPGGQPEPVGTGKLAGGSLTPVVPGEPERTEPANSGATRPGAAGPGAEQPAQLGPDPLSGGWLPGGLPAGSPVLGKKKPTKSTSSTTGTTTTTTGAAATGPVTPAVGNPVVTTGQQPAVTSTVSAGPTGDSSLTRVTPASHQLPAHQVAAGQANTSGAVTPPAGPATDQAGAINASLAANSASTAVTPAGTAGTPLGTTSTTAATTDNSAAARPPMMPAMFGPQDADGGRRPGTTVRLAAKSDAWDSGDPGRPVLGRPVRAPQPPPPVDEPGETEGGPHD